MGRAGVLVVGPSEVFVGYVARGLPSLGEEAVTLDLLRALATEGRTILVSMRATSR